MGTLKSFFDKNSLFWLGIILVVSTYLKFAYVFYFTDFHNYLYGEMEQIWKMATESFYRGDIEIQQWLLWPPIAHIALSWIFKILYLLELYQYKLEVVLGINIILSAIEVILIYLISLKLLNSKIYGLIVALFYAFFFPLIYLNSFILILNPALFLYMLSITIFLYSGHEALKLFLSGSVLALSVSFEPSWILSIVPFAGYVLFDNGKIRDHIIPTIILIAGFVFVIFMVIVQNNAISTGRLKTLSTNEGLEYMLRSCNAATVVSNTKDGNVSYTPISTTGTPEMGIIETNKPFYEQLFFYKKGEACQRQNALSISEKLGRYNMLWNGTMYPLPQTANFAKNLLPIFDKLLVWLSLLLLFVPILYTDKRLSGPVLSLFVTLMTAQLILLGSLCIDRRDMYGLAWEIMVLALAVPFAFVHTISRLWWLWVVAIVIIGGFSIETATKKPKLSGHISTRIELNSEYIYDIDQERKTKLSTTREISTIDLEGQYSLKHREIGQLVDGQNFFVDMRVGANIAQDGNYTITVITDSYFRLKVDDKVLIENDEDNKVSLLSQPVFLSKGKHRFDITYGHANGRIILRVYYKHNDTGHLLGENSPDMRFFYIREDEHFIQKKLHKKKKKIRGRKRQKKLKATPKKHKSKQYHHSK